MPILYENWDLSIEGEMEDFAGSYMYELEHGPDQALLPIEASDFQPLVVQSIADKTIGEVVGFLGFCVDHEEPAMRNFGVDLALDAIGPYSPALAAIVTYDALDDSDFRARVHAANRIGDFSIDGNGSAIEDMTLRSLITAIRTHYNNGFQPVSPVYSE
jgi:hypothetical protein